MGYKSAYFRELRCFTWLLGIKQALLSTSSCLAFPPKHLWELNQERINDLTHLFQNLTIRESSYGIGLDLREKSLEIELFSCSSGTK